MTRAGVPFLATLPVAFLVPAIAGIVLERTLYQRLYKATHLDQVMFSIGLVFMVRGGGDVVLRAVAAAGAAARLACAGRCTCWGSISARIGSS